MQFRVEKKKMLKIRSVFGWFPPLNFSFPFFLCHNKKGFKKARLLVKWTDHFRDGSPKKKFFFCLDLKKKR